MKQEDNKLSFYIKNVLIGVFISFILIFALFAIFSLAFSKSKVIPISIINQAPFVLILIAAFIGSFLTAKFARSKGMLLGLIVGFSFFVILSIISYLISHQLNINILLIRGISTLLTSSIGGIIGVNKNKKRRKI